MSSNVTGANDVKLKSEEETFPCLLGRLLYRRPAWVREYRAALARGWEGEREGVGLAPPRKVAPGSARAEAARTNGASEGVSLITA